MSFAAQLRPYFIAIPAVVSLTAAPTSLAGAGLGGSPVQGYSSIIPWGASSVGQGDVPTVSNSVTITHVSLGRGHGAVRYSDGTVALWGDDNHGQATLPTVGEGITFDQIEAGAEHTIARLSDGTIIAWGWDSVGQTQVPDLGGQVALLIGAGNNHNLAQLSNGVVIGWGDGSDGQTNPPLALTTPDPSRVITTLAGGLNHSAALLGDGSILCWGNNDERQCEVPVLAGGETYHSVQCGNNFTIALTSTNQILVWGDPTYSTLPVDIVGTPLEAGGRFVNAYARTDTGAVKVWGDDTDGQSAPPEFREYVVDQIAVGNQFLAASAMRDCDSNGVPDRDQILADPTLDCDEDGELDSCTIAADTTNLIDWNDNGILDRCELEGNTTEDCNGNGKYDAGELAEGVADDCDEDGVIDSCQIAEDSSLDCDGDGVLDSCEPTATGVSSTTVSPIDAGDVVTASGTDMAPAAFDVQVKVTAKADLGSFGEWFVMRLNDTIIDYVFVTGGENCASSPQISVVEINKDLWNSLTEDGEVELTITASDNVSAAECTGSSAKIEATWLTDLSDCNGNGTPDLCELRDGTVADVDDNGVPDSCERYPGGDLNRDRKSDVMLYHSKKRQIQVRYLNNDPVLGLSFSNPLDYPKPDNGYAPAGVGDFDGDGYNDIVFRFKDQRGIQVRLIEADQTIQSGNPGSVQSRRQELIAITDLDGNGTADLIWRHSYSKDVTAWLMQGIVLTDEISLSNSAGLTFIGAGDVDADGDADLVWRNNDTNLVEIWTTQDGEFIESNELAGGSALASPWEGRGVGDINGDGYADIVWRNKSTAELKGWLLGEDGFSEADRIGTTSPTGYDIIGMADYNGDGKSDLALWKSDNREFRIWALDGFDRVNEKAFTTDGKQRFVKSN